ncbi:MULTISPECIES: hypothetical protein [Rhodococcus]|uniref:hypothetical protein n=1 Tax=Rhodococcus TaxID=1827 RepID=UPI0011AF2F2A|nr:MULTISPECIES: hypothetical protein [Rhodococcus]
MFLNVLAISWVREAALTDETSGGALEDIMRAGWARDLTVSGLDTPCHVGREAFGLRPTTLPAVLGAV